MVVLATIYWRGGGGNDTLRGGKGVDELKGGDGQDTYIVQGVASSDTADMDKLVDDIIRTNKSLGDDNDGVGDFNNDGIGDRNFIEFEVGGNISVALGYLANTIGSGTLDFVLNAPASHETSMEIAAIDEVYRLDQAGQYAADFDFDNSSDIDSSTLSSSDLHTLITEVFGTFLGDINLDGSVNAIDLNIVGLNWLMDQIIINHWQVGDVNGDGIVDAQDLNVVGANWQFTNDN